MSAGSEFKMITRGLKKRAFVSQSCTSLWSDSGAWFQLVEAQT